MTTQQFNQQQLMDMLSWQADMGADEALLDTPSDGLSGLTLADFVLGACPQRLSSIASLGTCPPTDAPRITQSKNKGLSETPPAGLQSPPKKTLDHLTSLSDLATALDQLHTCPLKNTASSMCFADGNAGARLMIIGETPGRDEDRLGMPFVGASGQFLDSMMASIGLDRSGVYLINFLPWRPPGNRTPTTEEIDMLLPFLHRHVQLANPEMILILGGAPAKVILNNSDNILKLRGRWQGVDYGDGVLRPTMASLHPHYLMRSPAQKRLAFNDWLCLYQQLSTTAPPIMV